MGHISPQESRGEGEADGVIAPASPIDQSLQSGHSPSELRGLAGLRHATVSDVQSSSSPGKQSQLRMPVPGTPEHGVQLGVVDVGKSHTQSTELGSPAQAQLMGVSSMGTLGAGHAMSGHGSGAAQPGGHTRGVQPEDPPKDSRHSEFTRRSTRLIWPLTQ